MKSSYVFLKTNIFERVILLLLYSPCWSIEATTLINFEGLCVFIGLDFGT